MFNSLSGGLKAENCARSCNNPRVSSACRLTSTAAKKVCDCRFSDTIARPIRRPQFLHCDTIVNFMLELVLELAWQNGDWNSAKKFRRTMKIKVHEPLKTLCATFCACRKVMYVAIQQIGSGFTNAGNHCK